VTANAEVFISKAIEQPRRKLVGIVLLLSSVPGAGQTSHGAVERRRTVTGAASSPHRPQQPRQLPAELTALAAVLRRRAGRRVMWSNGSRVEQCVKDECRRVTEALDDRADEARVVVIRDSNCAGGWYSVDHIQPVYGRRGGHRRG